MRTPQSAWSNPPVPTKPWSCVWMERKMSFSQPGTHNDVTDSNTSLVHIHTCRHVHRYRKVPSNRCQGGFSPQLAMQTLIRPCSFKPSPGPPARDSSPITHFDTPVSTPGWQYDASYWSWVFVEECVMFVFVFSHQREKLVLILVCAGAGVIVLVAVVSAVIAARRAVYRHRWAEHTDAVQHAEPPCSHAQWSGVIPPSTGQYCIASQTSRFRTMKSASRPISQVPQAAMAQPASKTQMT